MKTFLAVLFLVACATGQKRGFIAVTSDGVGHWCETNKPSVYTPAITLNKNGSVSCPAGSHVVSDKEKPMPKEFLEPEPMDVPAIDLPAKKVCVKYSDLQWNGNQCDKYQDFPRYSCADKSRILLTAEDGSKHCVKFPKE